MIWILFIGTMTLSLWAMWRVKSVYKRYSQGVVRSGLTGGEVAAQHARAYAPLHWRMAAVGITTYANYVVMFLPLLGLFTGLITPLTGALFMAVA